MDDDVLKRKQRISGVSLLKNGDRRHYVIFLHGIQGNPEDFGNFCSIYHSYDPDATLLPVSAYVKGTSLGTTICARRSIDYIISDVHAGSKISFICHSFGGLVGRQIINILQNEHTQFWESLEKVIFCTFATPHLGVQETSMFGFTKMAASYVCGRSGREMTFSTKESEGEFSKDDDSIMIHLMNYWKKSLPLSNSPSESINIHSQIDNAVDNFHKFAHNHILVELVSDSHLTALQAFRTRAMIHNTSNDNMVGKLTGLALVETSKEVTDAWLTSKSQLGRLVTIQKSTEATSVQNCPGLLDLSEENRLKWVSDRIHSVGWDMHVVYFNIPLLTHNFIICHSRLDLAMKGKQVLDDFMNFYEVGSESEKKI